MVYLTDDRESVKFSTGMFFYFILPPIIFAAGYNLKSKNFFLNFGYISLYGFLGTFLSFITLGLLAIFLNANGALPSDLTLTTRDCLLLACVLTATDTVAAISVIKEEKYPKLNSILFGEGVLNDAVSIVLFRTVESVGDSFGVFEGFELVWSFMYVLVISITLGMGFGLLCSILIKRTPNINKHPERETTLVIMMGYLAYVVSELLDFSGIMTIFICGVTMNHYAWYNLSIKSQQGTKLAFNVLAQGAEAFTFTYLGMTATTVGSDNWSFLFLICMLVAMMIARGASVFISSAFVYFLQCRRFGLDLKNILVIWFSGLIRGAVAFALVLQISSDNEGVLVTTTMGISLLTTLVFTNILVPFTKFIGLEETAAEKIYFELMAAQNSKQDEVFQRQVEESGLTWFHKKWLDIDEKYLKPIFGGEEEKPQQKTTWDRLWDEDDFEDTKMSNFYIYNRS